MGDDERDDELQTLTGVAPVDQPPPPPPQPHAGGPKPMVDIDEHRCASCGRRFDEHVYVAGGMHGRAQGAFDVPTTNLYCPE